jgi:hypothetical protein
VFVDPFGFLAWLLAALNRRDGFEGVPWAPAIAVKEETWRVVGPDGSTLAAGVSEAQAHQLARANGAVAVAAGDVLAGAGIGVATGR